MFTYKNRYEILLKRTFLKLPFEKFIKKIENIYPSIGIIKECNPVLEGYEDANFIIDTNMGKFVLKIFLRERTGKNIRDYIKILLEAEKIGVPVIKLIKGNLGFLSTITFRNNIVYFYISKFFDGENFETKTPRIFDVVKIIKYLARLNTLQFQIGESYDSWGNKNLLKEYELNKNKISTEVNTMIIPTITKLTKLEFNKFSKSVIHGDMQRKHVLKNKKGEYCILDFGCASYAGKVFEISTFLAWFCLDENNWKDRKKIYSTVITEYTKRHNLANYELKSIPLLIEASYVSYFLKTSLLIQEGDKSEETYNWHVSAKKMLQKFRK